MQWIWDLLKMLPTTKKQLYWNLTTQGIIFYNLAKSPLLEVVKINWPDKRGKKLIWKAISAFLRTKYSKNVGTSREMRPDSTTSVNFCCWKTSKKLAYFPVGDGENKGFWLICLPLCIPATLPQQPPEVEFIVVECHVNTKLKMTTRMSNNKNNNSKQEGNDQGAIKYVHLPWKVTTRVSEVRRQFLCLDKKWKLPPILMILWSGEA